MSNDTSDMTFLVPAAIAALPLAIGEKLALARIDENPRCRNADLAKEIGITVRGIKKMVLRLKSAGYLQQARKGRARRLFLKFHVEPGTKFPQTQIATKTSKGELCSDVASPGATASTAMTRAVVALDEYFEQTLDTIDEITRQRDFYPETVVHLLQSIIARIEVEMEESLEKKKILGELMARQGAFMAISLGARLPKRVQRRLDGRICQATAEQLVEFRYRAVACNLEDKAPLKLAAFGSEEAER